MKIPKLILASSSPRRINLLRQVGFSFVVKPSRVEERLREDETPAQNARRIALEKALGVHDSLTSGIIVGADTIVVLGKKILGKPKDKSDARSMLRMLSGKTHIVYTGFALVDARTGMRVTDVEKTFVTFRVLSTEEIRRYVDSGSPMDKAGGYGIQDDYGAVFVEKVNGCFYNVMGFPLSRFFTVLKGFIRLTRRRKSR
jgi:septum formation protein